MARSLRTPSLPDLVKKGYLPREVPSCFSTDDLARIASRLPTRRPATEPVRHSLARYGGLRRMLSIPHPQSYLALAKDIVSNWTIYATHWSKSRLSRSKPTCGRHRKGRAISTKMDLADLPLERSKTRALATVLLVSDITQFYDSVYTHSIPWAMSSKASAKRALKAGTISSVPGNSLDVALRNVQDKQSVGIPTGPDTSLVAAEIILAAVDEALMKKGPTPLGGFRFMDDFELAYRTISEAEDALATLESTLERLHLSLNPLKTRIDGLPDPYEPTWRIQLNRFVIRTNRRRSVLINDLISFFSLAYDLYQSYPNDPVLSYALQKAGRLGLDQHAWPVFRNNALAIVQREPAALPFYHDRLVEAVVTGIEKHLDPTEEVLNLVADQHATRGRGFEVVWTLWTLARLGLPLGDDVANVVCKIEDNLAILLYEWMRRSHLTSSAAPVADLMARLSSEAELASRENWLLAYESTRRGWHRYRAVREDKFFKVLLKENVAFFVDDAFQLPSGISSPGVDAGNIDSQRPAPPPTGY